MTGSHRRNPALVLLALAVALVAAVTTAADARDAGSSDAASVRIQDDARVDGDNVVIADWNPALDSAAGRATKECFFPAR